MNAITCTICTETCDSVLQYNTMAGGGQVKDYFFNLLILVYINKTKLN